MDKSFIERELQNSTDRVRDLTAEIKRRAGEKNHMLVEELHRTLVFWTFRESFFMDELAALKAGEVDRI